MNYLKAILVILILSLFSMAFAKDTEQPIIDSNMKFEESIAGTKAPKDVIRNIRLVDVRYYSTDGKLHQGQLVVHKDLVEDIKAIFDLIVETKFPVVKCIPIVKYNWSDDASMADNNSSAFCYRFIAGTKRLSNHSFGRAVDINPFFNPVEYKSGKVSPKGAKYDVKRPGSLTEDNPIVKEFLKRGWRWGRSFSKYKDNHHFDKN